MLFRLFRPLPHSRIQRILYLRLFQLSNPPHLYRVTPRASVANHCRFRQNLNSCDCNAGIKALRWITELSISRPRISWVHSALPRKALKSRGGIGPLASKRRARSYPVTSISRERSAGPLTTMTKVKGRDRSSAWICCSHAAPHADNIDCEPRIARGRREGGRGEGGRCPLRDSLFRCSLPLSHSFIDGTLSTHDNA